MVKMFQINEGDLATLESLLPSIAWAQSQAMNDVALRMKFRQVKEIISNVRWNYGPVSDVESIDP